MGTPFQGPAPEMIDSPTARQYHELMEQSDAARDRGNHWEAQKLVTAAHKWAMSERIRLQQLAHARESLARATKRLQSTQEKASDCRTVEELLERHPEFKSVVTAWEKAQQLVRELEDAQPADVQSR